MYKAIVNCLCCPKCRKNLYLRAVSEYEGDVIDGTLICETGHVYRISRGVVDFNSEEQGFANQWEAMGEERNFEEMDREIDTQNPTDIIQRREMVLKAIVDAITGYECKVVLDIASGRGLMLTELCKALDDDVHIISIDLSSYVLKYDRQKFGQMFPNRKISYLACDATNLPIKECLIDAATTYCGFSNMIGCAHEALREAHMVIKPGGVLADSYVVIQQESQGYKTLQQVCNEQCAEGAEDFFLHDSLTKHHDRLFSNVECNVVFEGIGVGNGMDLLPYHGEWYAEHVYVSEK